MRHKYNKGELLFVTLRRMEHQLIKQIKGLKAINPDKEWVFSTKEDILGKKEARWLPLHLHRQAFLIGSVAAVLAVVIGIFGLNSYGQPAPEEVAVYENIASSLKELEANLNATTIELKNIKEVGQALEVEKTVAATIEQGEGVVSRARKDADRFKAAKAPKEEVLAVLTEVESALSQMKEANTALQQEIAQREIAELKGSALTEEQAKLLEEAVQYFEQENYPQALEKIIEISLAG